MPLNIKTHDDIGEWLVDSTVKSYLNSNDFNGHDWSFLPQAPDMSVGLLKAICSPLIAAGRLSGRYEEFDVNPFIKRFPDQEPSEELKMLEKASMRLAKLYPTRIEMKKRVRASRFPGRPYTLELARGSAQLEPKYFDLVVLEQYRNDPRYRVHVSDMGGSINAGCEGHSRPADEVFLRNFGFGYDSDGNRAVMVCLWYLHELSPEHQQLWKARELTGVHSMHPDYYSMCIEGCLPENIQVIDAILWEQKMLNEIAVLLGRPALFKTEFLDERPAGLMFLIRPTEREFGLFVHLLDKVLSENINKKFFGTEVALIEESPRKDGRIEVVHKNTLRLLEEWLTIQYPNKPGYPIQEMMKPLKEVRKIRQQPAHSIGSDSFSQQYFHRQRELLADVCSSLRGIRQLLGEHPSARDHQLPEMLRDVNRIRLF